jgi:hypothetical protein
MSEFDFSNLTYGVHTLKGNQDPFLVFEDFKKYEEFHVVSSLPRRNVLKYLVYFYDPLSPILDEVKDPLRAKLKAVELAGFKKENGKYSENVEKMIVCEDPIINEMICRYLIMTNDIRWQKYHVLMQVYFRIAKDLLTGEKDNMKNFAEAEKELIATRNQITKLETSETLLKRLQKYYLEGKVELSPEEIAIKLRANPNELPQ